MAKKWLLFSVAIFVFCIAGCMRQPASPAGFRLPDGDAMNGREVFVRMQCNQCHTVDKEEFPAILGAEPPFVALGGSVTRVKTYGELVTSIINPSHKLARGYAAEVVANDGMSKMNVYNDYMTVRELTDLVAYLQPKYDVIVPQHTYRVYP